MINVNTVPIRGVGATSIVWAAPILTLDDVGYDLSALPDGGSADMCNGQLRHVTRTGDDYSVKVAVAFDPADEVRTTIDPMEFTLEIDGVIL